MSKILLGYEIGSGAVVEIPQRHMVVTGQTQESGKTTTLEALVARAGGAAAIAFLTKRGEGGFADARIVRPYFKEEANWQYVASILEASRGEKLKFERAWIIRAAKGARTLADVHRNVRKAMETAKGLSADVYLTLDAYLEAVVPQIERVQWAGTVDLRPGMNAMDLTGLNVEMQHLVIRSTIDWVLNNATNTIVVVPEAWKFIPQGRGTPVKLAAEAYIRQAAALRNYLWLDSQDIAGVEKLILKSVPVWILGVQREANEIKRTLDQIPAGVKKPKPADIATLAVGEFIACYGSHTTKVYVQPSWMNPAQAQQVATGQLAVGMAAKLSPRPPAIKPTEVTVNETEARELRDENARLRQQVVELERQFAARVAGDHSKLALATPSPRDDGAGDAVRAGDAVHNEFLYQAFKARLTKEAPGLLRVLTIKPELEVTVSRKTITAEEHSLKGRIAKLLAVGFFSDTRGPSAVRGALKKTGPDANTANIGRALDDFTKDGFVTDEGSGYRAVEGMKVNIIHE